MRAERDEDGYRPINRKKERSLIAQIAIGVFVGNLALWAVEQTVEYFHVKWQLGQIKIQIHKWEMNGRKGNPFPFEN